MPKRFGLTSTERLKSRKQIDLLFAKGSSFFQFPIRVSYQFDKGIEGTIQIGVTASKRNFKKAVDRNRIKRLLREAYRLQKEELVSKAKEAGKNGIVFFVYTDKTIADFTTVKVAMAKCLQRLTKLLQSEDPS